MKTIINGTKISNGDVGESVKVLFIIRPVAFRILLRQQGINAGPKFHLPELMQLVEDVKKGKRRVNFSKIVKTLPISGEQISAAADRYQIRGDIIEKPKVFNQKITDRLNIIR